MTAPLKQRLHADLVEARRARDKERTVLLSTTLSELRNREIEVGREADDDLVIAVLGRALKQRRDAAEQMRAGGRDDLAQREESEAALLEGYLPAPLDPGEVRAMIEELRAEGVAEMGAMMGRLMPRLRGRFDGREAGRLVREALGS